MTLATLTRNAILHRYAGFNFVILGLFNEYFVLLEMLLFVVTIDRELNIAAAAAADDDDDANDNDNLTWS